MAADEPHDPHDPHDPDELTSLLRQGVKSTLARWVLHRRWRGGAPTPSTRDEGTHRWDGRRRFAEDYSFGVAQSGLGLVVRTEWLPGRGAHRVWVVLLTGERALITPLMASGPALIRGRHQPWSVGGLQIDCSQPHVRWTIQYSGELADTAEPTRRERTNLDLTFVRTADPFVPGTHDDPDLVARNLGGATWNARLLRSLRRGASRGYVQLGEVHGSVALGSRMIPVRATAVRGHTWGVRDWGAADLAMQAVLALADGRRAWVHRAQFPWMTLEGGFAREDAGASPLVRPVRSVGLTREARPDGAPARVSFHLEYGGESGRATDLSVGGELVNSVGIAVDGRGQVELGLLELPDGGAGLWARQRRTLPRPRG